MAARPPTQRVINDVRRWWRWFAGEQIARDQDIYRLFITHASAAWEEAGRPFLTSWYRNGGTNREAGGEPGSQHQLALALDFVRAGTRQLIDDPAGAFERRGFTVIRNPAGFHVQMFPASLGVHQSVAEFIFKGG